MWLLDLGSGIQDPGWIKSGSGIRNKDPGSATLPDPGFLLNPDPNSARGFQIANLLPQNEMHFFHEGLPKNQKKPVALER